MSTHTVLVVDDEPHIRYVLELKLQEAGYEVLTASNGQQAYELACDHRVSVVITDFQMPGCSGLEFTQMLAANPATASVPAIMLTARGHRVPPDELARTSVREVIAKPFSPRELLRKVEALLDESSDTHSSESAAA